MLAKFLPKRYRASHTEQGLPVGSQPVPTSEEYKVDGQPSAQAEEALLLDDAGVRTRSGPPGLPPAHRRGLT